MGMLVQPWHLIVLLVLAVVVAALSGLVIWLVRRRFGHPVISYD